MITKNSKVAKNRPWMGLVVLVFYGTVFTCLGYLVWLLGAQNP